MPSILESIPSLQQRQDSLMNQLQDLVMVANKLGMYDAADAVRHLLNVDVLSGAKYGCHADLDSDMEPDDCVIDSNMHHHCVYAKKGIRKEQCEYWRIVGLTK